MNGSVLVYIIAAAVALVAANLLVARLRLARAKHPSLRGHASVLRRVARFVRFYQYDAERFFSSDGAPPEIAEKRRQGFDRIATEVTRRARRSIALGNILEDSVSDVLFTNMYRVPFQYRNLVRERLPVGTVVDATAGTKVRDLDGNWSYDLTGSYGANVFGYDFYKECIDAGVERVRELGPVLGSYHPLIAENVSKLKRISGLDEVSFHMSGTEAVMQAVRLARFHTGRPRLVMFCGAYHGWWDGVQPGLGNSRSVDDVYTLEDMSKHTLRVLETRRDIACVLVNPVQAMHPNASAPGDGTLVSSARSARFDRAAYSRWLAEVRAACTRRGIVLIFDEVLVGFRIAYGGAQEYFGVRADIVTYGKTLGGGLPIGVVCGKHGLMKRFRADRPSQVSFARGTFNSHPYVLGAMNEFLRRIDEPERRAAYAQVDAVWNARAVALNRRLEDAGVPVRIVNFTSIWTILYLEPCRYNWMLQFYLREKALALSWIGTGRLILSHNYSDQEYAEVMERFLAAALAMQADGWWWVDAKLTNRAIVRRIAWETLLGRPR